MQNSQTSSFVKMIVLIGAVTGVAAIGPVNVANFAVDNIVGMANNILVTIEEPTESSRVEEGLVHLAGEFEQWSVGNPVGFAKAIEGNLPAEEIFHDIDDSEDYSLDLSNYDIQYTPVNDEYRLEMSTSKGGDKAWIYSSEDTTVTEESPSP